MGDRWLLPGDYQIFIGHAGHVEKELSFSLTGSPTVLQPFPRQPRDNILYKEESQHTFKNHIKADTQ